MSDHIQLQAGCLTVGQSSQTTASPQARKGTFMCNIATCSSTESQVSAHRLSGNVVPNHYQLKLSPDLTTATYEGEVSIDLTIKEPCSEIALNASGTAAEEPKPSPEMIIHSATLTAKDGTSFNGTPTLDPAKELLKISFAGKAGSGDWHLKITFSGTLNDKLRGFYRSSYKDADGATQVVACTQFESTDARRAFPCFDEPAMKATFQVTMVVDSELEAVSNTQVTSVTQLTGGKKQIEFAPSMKMSTYLLAFVVGKLVATQPLSVDGVDVRIWTIPSKQHLTCFGLETAAFSLRYFRQYFGCPYPGDKLDLLGIPDFAAGAMENLGCVTFREEALLVDHKSASQAALDRVAEVVAHELAHMWFGDLVTMAWWEGLWLNEAFATFMAAKCVDSWKKDWGIWERFALSRSAAMRTDALKSTRPVQFVVDHPDEAAAMFDILTYQKGCSVMRMLEQYLGEETFRKGIALYMERHAYGNTHGEDLWRALTDESGEDVAAIMESWVYRPGFPVLSVESANTTGSITLRQRSFKYLPEAVDDSTLWKIPIFVRARVNGKIIEEKFILHEAEKSFYLGEGLEWVVINANGHSFVRVVYDGKLVAGLARSAANLLSVVERYNLLSDSWACVRAAMSSTSEFLALTKAFADETDPNVWTAILGPLYSIYDTLPAGNRTSFASMVKNFLRPVYEKLGWQAGEEESVQTRELRAKIIGALADIGNDSSVQAEASRLYESWKKDRTVIDPNLTGTIISICAASGNSALHKEFFGLFKQAGTPQEEKHFLDGLASFRNAELLKETLSLALNPEKIRTQDAPFTVAAVMRNDAGTELAWEFVKNNWAKMRELYPEPGLVRMCSAICYLDEEKWEKDAKEFFATHEVPTGKKQIEQTLEQLRINVLYRNRELEALSAAFPQA